MHKFLKRIYSGETTYHDVYVFFFYLLIAFISGFVVGLFL